MESREITKFEARHRDMEARLLQDTDTGFVHHVADLTNEKRIPEKEFQGEVPLANRLQRIASVANTQVSAYALLVETRTLTPRKPFLEFPVSALQTWGNGWDLWTFSDELYWEHDGDLGGLDLYYQGIAPEVAGVVRIEATVTPIGPGPGALTVAQTVNASVQFMLQAGRHHSIDLLVTASTDILTVMITGLFNFRIFSFRKATYFPTLTSMGGP